MCLGEKLEGRVGRVKHLIDEQSGGSEMGVFRNGREAAEVHC